MTDNATDKATTKRKPVRNHQRFFRLITFWESQLSNADTKIATNAAEKLQTLLLFEANRKAARADQKRIDSHARSLVATAPNAALVTSEREQLIRELAAKAAAREAEANG